MTAYGEITWRTAKKRAGTCLRHARPRAKALDFSLARLLRAGKQIDWTLVVHACALAFAAGVLAAVVEWGWL